MRHSPIHLRRPAKRYIRILAGFASAGFCLAAANGRAAPVESVLWNFSGGSDGSEPHDTLVMDKSGALYGTTEVGDYSVQAQFGTIFKLIPPAVAGGASTLTTLYTFTGGADGAYPLAGLIMDGRGALYGTTEVGGGACQCGVVFKLTPPAAGTTNWTESVLWAFQGKPGAAPGGNDPKAGLTLDAAGNLYGVTQEGGSADAGVVFELSPPPAGQQTYTETVLYNFSGIGSDTLPRARLIRDTAGNLYGTTSGANNTGYGEVFELSPPSGTQASWSEKILWSFAGVYDGAYPGAGVIMDKAGALYGVTMAGGGTGSYYAQNGNGAVYKLTPPAAGGTQWSESIIWNFPNVTRDGNAPSGDLLMDRTGNIYGTTYAGGILEHGPGSCIACGTVWQLKPPATGTTKWREVTLYNFGTDNTCHDGAASTSGLIMNSARTLFGTTTVGGSSQVGNVFQITP